MMTEHSTVPQLPEELLSQVLRHVDCGHRLRSCSLVCKAWRAAATAATSTVWMWGYMKSSMDRRYASLMQWLLPHGAAVTELILSNDARVSYHPSIPVQLPYSNLRQLQRLYVNNCKLLELDSNTSDCSRGAGGAAIAGEQPQQQQLASNAAESISIRSSAGSSHPSLSSLTSLTDLCLKDVTYSLSDSLGSCLPALAELQRLQLGPLQLPRQPLATELQQSEAQQELWRGVLHSLPVLTLLTSLELACEQLPSIPDFSPFSSMQHLQGLDLLQAPVRSLDLLQELPAALTRLELALSVDSPLSSRSIPSLPRLTTLQHLIVETENNTGFDPGFLGSMQQLRLLSLRGPMVCDSRQYGSGGAAPVSTLLAVMPALSKLESLLIANAAAKVQLLPASEVARYSALLPPSQELTHLELSWISGSMLAPDCGPYVFEAGRHLTKLTQLVIGLPSDIFDWAGSDIAVAEMVPHVGGCFGPGDVARLVECCPALETLWVPGLVQPGVDMSPLTALTALTELLVGGEAVDDGVASSVLAKMTGLERLRIYHAPQLADEGLLALSSLRCLQQLAAWKCGFSRMVSDEDHPGSLDMEYTASAGAHKSQRLNAYYRYLMHGPHLVRQPALGL
jgi:hypothetical protein